MSARSNAPARQIVVVACMEAVPVEGCDVCGALATQRERARRADNRAKVKSCNEEILSHPHRMGVRK